ncbi:CNNM domain-containing protein [Oerskovia sp. M15]
MMMAGAQLGITVCSLALGLVSEPVIAHLLEVPFSAWGVPEALVHPVALVIALGLVTYLHVVLGEMVPKNIALAGPERVALVLAPVLVVVVRVLFPVLWLLNGFANLCLRAVRVQPRTR